jgi:hypothetical protein
VSLVVAHYDSVLNKLYIINHQELKALLYRLYCA